MKDWGDFKGKIGDALKKIHASPYTREAIIAGLSAVPIPFVGTYLAGIYQHAVGPDQDKNKEIIKLLENLQKMRDTDLEFFVDSVAATKEQMEKDGNSLKLLVNQTNQVVEQLNRIERGTEGVKEGNDKIFSAIQVIIERHGITTKDLINRMDYLQTTIVSNFENSNPVVKKFDFSIDAERLLFYLRLREHLLESSRIFFNQVVISNKLIKSLESHGNPIDPNVGMDEILFKFYDIMNVEERDMFDFLRKTLKDVWTFNSHAKELIMANNQCLTDMPELFKLLEHYSWWQAKYELLKNNPRVPIVFVGVKQEKRFPKIDDVVNKKIIELRKKTKLDLIEFQQTSESANLNSA